MDIPHVLGVVGLVLTGISAAMSIVYYALAFSDRKREKRKKQAE
ncbi:MAG TPA: hypothetical protein VKU00_02600 [Chthonomonadaceae bacterium]|nr:hypothetical protein [Chthonomonadaceae bacterium]